MSAAVERREQDLRLRAGRFLRSAGKRVGRPFVWRVEEEGPAIFWILYSISGQARDAMAAGQDPKSWRLIDDAPGWPIA